MKSKISFPISFSEEEEEEDWEGVQEIASGTCNHGILYEQ